MTMKVKIDDILRCSFCNKHQRDVKKLIAGPSVYICDECVDICNEIIAGDVALVTQVNGPVVDSLVEAGDRITPGYDGAKRLIAAALVEQAVRAGEDGQQPGLAPLFIVGGTGAAKSLFVKAMAERAGLAVTVVDVPLLFEDAMFKQKIDFAAFEQRPGVIILNHVEALAMRGKRSEQSKRLQESLISLIDGSLLPIASEGYRQRKSFDTARTLFIALAALPEVEHADAGAIADQGYLPELVSRFGSFITLPPLDEEHMRELLTRVDGFVTACTARFARSGMRVTVDDSAVKEIVQLGVRRKAGLRGLKALVDRLGMAIACERVADGQELKVDSDYIRRHLQ
jgi:ATP-dependent Clp protease ATP-binding subunit ClpX